MIRIKSGSRKYYLKFLATIGVLGIVIYPIIIGPMKDATGYKEIQKKARMGIDQDKIQPGNMRVWSDPFDRTKTKDHTKE